MEKMNTNSSFDIVVNNIKNLIKVSPKFKIAIQHIITEDTKEEAQQDYISLLETNNFIFFQIDLYNFKGKTVEQAVKEKVVGCDMIFGGELPFVHWNGDLAGCCNDDTDTPV